MINENLILKHGFPAVHRITDQSNIFTSNESVLPQPIGFYPIDHMNDFTAGLDPYHVRFNSEKQQFTFPSCRLKLFTLKDAYFIVFPGLDGVIITSDGFIVDEPSCFSNKSLLSNLFAHTEIKETLDNAFVGFDGACHNYYHWLLYAISKTQMANAILPKDTVLTLPSEHSLFENRHCVYSRQTYTQILEAAGLNKRVTYLDYGIYPVKNLYFLWHNPIGPENYLRFMIFIYCLIK